MSERVRSWSLALGIVAAILVYLVLNRQAIFEPLRAALEAWRS